MGGEVSKPDPEDAEGTREEELCEDAVQGEESKALKKSAKTRKDARKASSEEESRKSSAEQRSWLPWPSGCGYCCIAGNRKGSLEDDDPVPVSLESVFLADKLEKCKIREPEAVDWYEKCNNGTTERSTREATMDIERCESARQAVEALKASRDWRMNQPQRSDK
eukprot:gnl/TRDRNA2_/TRDRNA2_157641_c0_seq1.p1 gnl/TRDRNA2_/TRDRNA2_157641_c0~~gnl/TRDRNA2_/TRDRNA2_157641_c0_seq1.p1  ORF type:complete len:172 (-),score=41.65 gnl/TRDRNA2_/TRDRNA2_157641_c0_seq1:123-617(-)